MTEVITVEQLCKDLAQYEDIHGRKLDPNNTTVCFADGGYDGVTEADNGNVAICINTNESPDRMLLTALLEDIRLLTGDTNVEKKNIVFRTTDGNSMYDRHYDGTAEGIIYTV